MPNGVQIEYMSEPFTGTPRGVDPYANVNWSAIPSDVQMDIGKLALAVRAQREQEARQAMASRAAAQQWAAQQAIRSDIKAGVNAQTALMRHPEYLLSSPSTFARTFGAGEDFGPITATPVKGLEGFTAVTRPGSREFYLKPTGDVEKQMTPSQKLNAKLRTLQVRQQADNRADYDPEYKKSDQYRKIVDTTDAILSQLEPDGSPPGFPVGQTVPGPVGAVAAPRVPVPAPGQVGPAAPSVPAPVMTREQKANQAQQFAVQVHAQHPNWTEEQVRDFVRNYMRTHSAR